jgi:hypothetical protein
MRAAPPIMGLVVSAEHPPDDASVRWESGFGWIPERCGYSYQLLPWCSADDPDPFSGGARAPVYYRPPGVRFELECSTLGGALDTEALRRVAEATTPFVVARELWTGELGSTDTWTLGGTSYTNAALASADATTVTTSATSYSGLLAALEYAAAEANEGQQIMIHLPIMLSGPLAQYVDKIGSNLITRSGNLVVLDAGYPGTGPNGETVGATAWAYATSLVQVRTSPLQVIEDPRQTVDRATNTVTAWAERVFAATFDPCVHFAIEINL